MDDRRFDSLTKAFASGTSRRTLFKGLLGLGGATIVGGALTEDQADAQRRPTPTPRPVTCPGRQTWNGTACVCPGNAPDKCGPDCCTESVTPPNTAGYSECCDNACCFGHCYGEELCCDYPLVFCEAQNECCRPGMNQCCGSEGCCDHACCPTTSGNQCCEGATPKCCGGDACIPADGCCSDAECGGGCRSCINHICVNDDSKCPGGTAGCMDCVNGTCQQNNANCDDGVVCTDNICGTDGVCTYPFDCTNGANCCVADPGSCQVGSCNSDTRQCVYTANCTNGGATVCCPQGQECDASTGGCYVPCEDERFGSCAEVPCCEGSGLTCFSILESPPICIDCIPSFFEGIPVPCLGFCDLCCSQKSFLGVCVDCGLQFNSCEDAPDSCCDGFTCCFNPIDDNFCGLIGTCIPA